MPSRPRRLPASLALAAVLAVAACGGTGSTGTPTVTPSMWVSPTTQETALSATSTVAPSGTSSSGAEPAPAALSGRTVGGTTLPGTGVPSRAEVPRTSPQGRPLRWYDDFTGSSLSGAWGVYDAVPRSSPQGLWRPSQVFVQDGSLVLRGEKQSGTWVTGGLANFTSASGSYGGYLVRFRMDRARGIKYAILLWPKTDDWPRDGEIDFAEDGGGSRASTTATLHFGEVDTKIQRSVDADFSTWHTVGVDWAPGRLTYTLDGRTWATVTTSAVPSGPMDLAIQTEAVPCGQPELGSCPDASTPSRVDMQVDWVAVYRY